MRKVTTVLTLILVAAVMPTGAASAACPTDWGSTRKTSDAHPDTIIVDARAGGHACFDRLVFVLDGDAPGYQVRYVDKFVPDASGRVRDLRGAATLQISMFGARAHDDEGQPTYDPHSRRNMADVSGFRTFRQVYWGGTFEATTVAGIGVRARLPFRVFVLDGSGSTSRLIVDVAHTW